MASWRRPCLITPQKAAAVGSSTEKSLANSTMRALVSALMLLEDRRAFASLSYSRQEVARAMKPPWPLGIASSWRRGWANHRSKSSLSLGIASSVGEMGKESWRKLADPPNGLELSCPAEAGQPPFILAHPGGPGAPPYAPARRVSFSELLGGPRIIVDTGRKDLHSRA